MFKKQDNVTMEGQEGEQVEQQEDNSVPS